MEENHERLLHGRSPGARKSALSPSDWRLFERAFGRGTGFCHRLFLFFRSCISS